MSGIITVELITAPRKAVQFDGSDTSIDEISGLVSGPCRVIDTTKAGTMLMVHPSGSTGSMAMRVGDWIIESPGVGPNFLLFDDENFCKNYKTVGEE